MIAFKARNIQAQIDQPRSHGSDVLTKRLARGGILGRKPKLTSHQRREAVARREAGEVLTDIARSYNVSHSTISRLS